MVGCVCERVSVSKEYEYEGEFCGSVSVEVEGMCVSARSPTL